MRGGRPPSTVAEVAAAASEAYLNDFEAYGSFAGPPSQPKIDGEAVGATSLLLTWEPPRHLGGSHFEVLGYQIRVRLGGDGEFRVHAADTGSESTQFAVENLEADAWHEFQVCAITSAGVGAASPPSHPVLTEPAPKLLRELRAAAKRCAGTRSRLARKRAELLHLAQTGTMALNAASSSAAEAKRSVQSRRALERQIEGLERKIAEQEQQLAALADEQEGVDEQRHAELEEAAAVLRGDADGASGGGGGAADEMDWSSGAMMMAGGASPAATALATGASFNAGHSFGGSGGASPAGGRSFARRPAMQDRKRLKMLEVYTRLFMAEDAAQQQTYAPFDREAVRVQLRRALSLHVLSSESEDTTETDKKRYFDLALNRARSALTHNVFPRFADWELEQLALLFGRLDADHDGVLEYADFCRLMMLVGERVNAKYKEAQLLRMFRKADVNGDNLIDFNEFLWMQTPSQQGASHAHGGWADAEDEQGGSGGDGAGVHPLPPTRSF